MKKLLAMGLACLATIGCDAAVLRNLLPRSLAATSTAVPPVIRGKVYGNAVGPNVRVAIKSTDEPGAGVFASVKIENGTYEYEFPKTYNENFELFAFEDDNGDGIVGLAGATHSTFPEKTSSQGRCGRVTVESPIRDDDGIARGKWTLRTCNEEEGPPSQDFDNADIRFSE